MVLNSFIIYFACTRLVRTRLAGLHGFPGAWRRWVLVQFDLFINTLILINKNASMRQGCLHSAHQAAFWSINIC
ncbi:MAG: hypothetical protein WC091_18070, partial [Sulfuricellaceae bacterium]